MTGWQLKLIGAIALLAAGTMLGFAHAGQLAARPRQMRQLIAALTQFAGDIRAGQHDLLPALQRCAAHAQQPVQLLFNTLALQPADLTTHEHWQATLDSAELRTKLALHPQDLQVLAELGATIGRETYALQLEQLQLALRSLNQLVEQAEAAHKQYGTLARSSGFLGALLLILLLYE